MQPLKVLLTLMFGMIVISCGGGTTAETDQNTSDLSSQEQAELVAAALSADQGGVGDDLAMVTQAVSGDLQQQARKPSANYGYNVSVNIDFYDEQDNPQQAYDPDTTDRISYQNVIQGEITNGTDFSVSCALITAPILRWIVFTPAWPGSTASIPTNPPIAAPRCLPRRRFISNSIAS